MRADVRERARSQDFDFWMGRWTVRNRRLVERLAGIRRVGRVRLEGRRPHAAGWARQRGRVLHRLRRWVRRDVLPILRSRDGSVVDLLGRQPPARPARPAGDRVVRRRHGRLRRRRHVRRPADPRAVHVVGRHDADAAVGAGLLATTARHGRRTGSWTSHARWRQRRERARAGRRRARRDTGTAREDRDAAAEHHARRRDPQVVRHRARADAPVPLAVRALARRCLRDAAKSGDARGRGRARLRHPPPLRRGLLLPPRLDLAERERALGDGLGEVRRRRRLLPSLAERRDAPPDVLRLGARRRRPRARRLERVPALRPRRAARRTYLRSCYAGAV